tara:strand:- start:281 stop:787 length:507 start_codon:yes stop_codon:yes gene_type:complete
MYRFLKKLISYFRTIEIYEKKTNQITKNFKKFKFKTFNRFSNIKSKEILNYFKIHKDKKKRFSQNLMFMTLSFNGKLVSSGWLFRGRNWRITEIDRKLNVKNKFVIFDFITPSNYRNKGYYTKLLKIILSKFKNKDILIYVLSSNIRSKKAILKAGFDYKYQLKKNLI